MGTGWRRAFCTSIRRDPEAPSSPSSTASPTRARSGAVSSNPSTPRPAAPKLQCKTTAPTTTNNPDPGSAATTPKPSPRPSPRSPSTFALLKTALRLSRNRCGICGESVSQRTVGAVFTAECSHAFHFPCISTHVRTHGSLVCPVCSADWREVPLLLSSSLPAHHHPGRLTSSREPKRTAPIKIYDDDEPLQHSAPPRGHRPLSGFNPIPEGLELDEEVDGDGNDQAPNRSTPEPAVSLVVPEKLALVSTGRNSLSYVLSIKMKAPHHPRRPQMASGLLDHPSCRSPIDLVTVLDVGAGMTVERLQMLKQAMRPVISSLGPDDRLSIVAFSVAAAKRLLPLRRMSRTGKRSARQIVDRLVICGTSHADQGGGGVGERDDNCSSGTAASFVGDALCKATRVLEDRRERNPVATIMLLSDGHGQGNAHKHHLQQSSSGTRFTHIEIPIDSSAAGSGDRMRKQSMPLAEEENTFAKCINGLVSVILQDVRIQFTFPSTRSGGGGISSVYSYNGSDDGGGIGQAISHGEGGKKVCIGDLYAGEERRLLVELKVPKTAVLGSAKHALSISVACTYRDPITREVILSEEQPIILPHNNNRFPIFLRSSSPSSSSMPSPRATSQQQQQQELRNLFVTTRALAESRRLVELGDLETALHLISSARSLLLQQSKSTLVTISHRKLVLCLDARLEELQRYQKQQRRPSPRIRSCEQALLAEARGGPGGGEPLTPTSAWRAAEQLAKVAIMRKSLNRVSDLHGFENARF